MPAVSLGLAVMYASLSLHWKAAFLALKRAPHIFIQPPSWGMILVNTTSLTHLLIYDVTKDVCSSWLMLLSWMVASLNICQSVHSKQSCRAAVTSSAEPVSARSARPRSEKNLWWFSLTLSSEPLQLLHGPVRQHFSPPSSRCHGTSSSHSGHLSKGSPFRHRHFPTACNWHVRVAYFSQSMTKCNTFPPLFVMLTCFWDCA